MQTHKQKTVTQFLNAQTNKKHYGFMDFMVDAVQWIIITTPMAIAVAGFFGAFDVK